MLCFSVCACGKWVCTSDKCSSGGKIGENIREGGDGAEGGEGGGVAEGGEEGGNEAAEEIRGKGREKAEGGKREIERKWWGKYGSRIRKYNENYKKGDKSEIDIEQSTTEREREMNIEYDTKEVDDLLKVEAYEDEEDPEDDPDVQDIRWF